MLPITVHNTFRKTRLAPTPSGFLHIGNVFSFALTAALAQRTGAGILLRIDDMDRSRANRQYLDDIFETLHFLQIPWQEGPADIDDFETNFSQRHRLPLYEKALAQLRSEGKVYACTCSRAQILRENADGIYPGTCRHKNIPLDTENASWRLFTADEAAVAVKNINGEIIKTTLPADMHDVIIRRRDGLPAYQLTSLVDDVHYGIDLIVRGADLWPSTLAQLYLAQQLGLNEFLNTTFLHHELLTDPDQRKLSKSAGDTSIRYLREHGWKREEVWEEIGKKVGVGGMKGFDF